MSGKATQNSPSDGTIQRLIVLGAGFSCPAGIPVMRDFFPNAWDILSHKDIPERRARQGLGGHTRDLPTFCAVESAWLAWTPDIPQDRFDLEAFAQHAGRERPGLLNDLIYVIVRTFELCKDREVGEPDSATWRNLYLGFARELIRHKDELAVLSFNYDLLLDQALLRENCAPEYYLPKEDVVPLNDPAKPTESVEILKPHGSINWLVCENSSCSKITVDSRPGPSDGNYPGDWQTGRALAATHHEYGVHLYPLIVPPQDKQDAERTVWQRKLLLSVENRISRLLPNIEKVLFIGWSAPKTDNRWRKTFSESLNSRCLNAYVANRESDPIVQREVKKRYREMLPGIHENCFFLGPHGDVREFATAQWWTDFWQ